jgi:thiol-disulfide isomerase/thioredoxin
VTRRRFWLATAAVGGLAAAAGYGMRQWLVGHPQRDANPAALRALMSTPLPDLEGVSRTLADWPGRVLVVNFWATWCAPCRKEIPEFVRVQARHGARGVQFVGIAIDQPGNVREFAREFQINYPLLVGNLATLALMRETGNRAGVLPFTLVLDRAGIVVNHHPGQLEKERLEAILEPLLDDKKV